MRLSCEEHLGSETADELSECSGVTVPASKMGNGISSLQLIFQRMPLTLCCVQEKGPYWEEVVGSGPFFVGDGKYPVTTLSLKSHLRKYLESDVAGKMLL